MPYFPPAPASTPAFTTGDVKPTYKTAADPGFVMLNDGTIGDASSGGTTRANADTVNLFELLWNNVSNANCPVSGGRGASAAADFAAHKTITLPRVLGRALSSAGAGSGLTSRALGDFPGAETQTLGIANIPSIFAKSAGVVSTASFSAGSDSNLEFTNPGGGSSTAFSIMQPAQCCNWMIAL